MLTGCNSGDSDDSPTTSSVAPWDFDLYLVGEFSGWGRDDKYKLHYDQGVYTLNNVEFSSGLPPFKVAGPEWNKYPDFAASTEQETSVSPDVDYPMFDNKGQNNRLVVMERGLYDFQVEVTNENLSSPSINFHFNRASDADMAMTNPHEGHEWVLKQAYPTWKGGNEQVTVSVKKKDARLREFALSTTQELRDPGDGYVALMEDGSQPKVNTGSLLFDALFALAINDMKRDSVSQISDGSYNGGAAIDCDCFKTGAKWDYVWTRDLSYAANLGLAALDPERVMNSLLFKLSAFRASLKPQLNPSIPRIGSGKQVIQDTGSGGSWPISTDRTTWALGAEKVLTSLPEDKASTFAREAFEALGNTLEADRQAAFDHTDGLYSGEQSFLDWREQTYAQWIRKDIAHIGMSKSLSTNATHYVALTLASKLATRQGDLESAKKYQEWADNLKKAINDKFWLKDQKMYASLTNTHTDNSTVAKFDMLGIALVTLTGIASEERAAQSLAHYPHGQFGVPVYFPQQPDVPVYHNRAIWPFVTAYSLKAAARVHNVAVFDNAMASLMRGAALNLSNMENLEWLSGQPSLMDVDNPDLSGPVINSQRQLWSVGGYLGMVTETLFGYHLNDNGFHINPFITAQAHKIMGAMDGVKDVARSFTLANLDYQGKKLSITTELPEYIEGSEGYYGVNAITLNGQAVSGSIDKERLNETNTIVVQMGALEAGSHQITRVDKDVKPLDIKDSRVFAPVEPVIKEVRPVAQGIEVAVKDEKNPGSGVTYNIYRDGEKVASNIDITQSWLDVDAGATGSHCYSAEAVYEQSGNSSHHAKPVCMGSVRFFSVDQLQHSSVVSAPDKHISGEHLKEWGTQQDQLALESLIVDKTGNYDISVKYNNSHHAINLGITNGVKQIKVFRAGATEPLAEGIIQLPHVLPEGDSRPLRNSTPISVDLQAGVQYRIEVVDYFNMSYMESNATYNDAGGVKPVNAMAVSGITVLEK